MQSFLAFLLLVCAFFFGSRTRYGGYHESLGERLTAEGVIPPWVGATVILFVFLVTVPPVIYNTYQARRRGLPCQTCKKQFILGDFTWNFILFFAGAVGLVILATLIVALLIRFGVL